MRSIVLVVLVAALAGCASSADRPPMSAKAETREVTDSETYPGLVVRGTLRAVADGLVVDAVARNTGNQTYQVETGCSTPWNVELFRGDERLAMQEPQVRCLAFALRDFAPGADLNFTTSWDGTIWDDARERQVRAADGSYEWSIRFIAYHSAQDAKRFDLDYAVTIG